MNDFFRTSAVSTAVMTLLLLTGCGTPASTKLDGVSALKTFAAPTAAPLSTEAPPSDVDLTFAREMITHHQQAVRMSVDLLKHDDTEGVVTDLAAFIQRDQQREITAMNDWLKAWEKAEPALFTPQPRSELITAVVGADGGMVSHGKEQKLAGLGGAQAQLSFLRLMIVHHQGAIEMSRALVENGANSFTRSVAKHILAEQDREVKVMQQVINQMCDGSRHDYCSSSHH